MFNSIYGLRSPARSTYKLINTGEIKSDYGDILIEQYNDGDTLLSFDQGGTWVCLSAQDQVRLVEFFGKSTAPPKLPAAVISKQKTKGPEKLRLISKRNIKEPTSRKKTKYDSVRNIRQVDRGWLVDLSDDVTHCYPTREKARRASITDAIGVNGRIS